MRLRVYGLYYAVPPTRPGWADCTMNLEFWRAPLVGGSANAHAYAYSSRCVCVLRKWGADAALNFI